MKLKKHIQELGVRMTPARKGIVDIFDQDCAPLSAKEVNEKLSSKGLKVNKTTVYREIDFLKSKKIIKEVVFGDGNLRYEKNVSECHHHAVCNSCGKVQGVQLDEKMLLNFVELKSNFKIENHSIEFFGLCNNCK